MAYDAAHGNVVLFGGFIIGGKGINDRQNFDDTWLWDGTNWTLLAPETSPPTRGGGGMVYDAGRGVVVLFGGFDIYDPAFVERDTWIWDGTTWTFAGAAIRPPARSSPAMTYDERAGSVILFGGFGYRAIYGDTWQLVGSFTSASASPDAPSELRASAVGGGEVRLDWRASANDAEGYGVYDGVRKQVVVATEATATSAIVRNLPADEANCFSVYAFNRAGRSAASTEVCTPAEAR